MKNMPPSTNNTWYFDKKELKNTPSNLAGLDYDTEQRYRREGARLILDIGNKMGLRFDTIWTGVLYFHRFYMFRSFNEFPRYVTATCCLFLAGKVEETPKKCKDLIKFARIILDDAKFQEFGEDPREEVMILERILLQTMNFDLQVEHSYSYLLKFAKYIKNVNDEKKQKMVQMAWTFINDSLQTTLHLQWEPDVIAVALMFLASRLTKLEIKDWTGRDPTVKMKWFEAFIEGVTQPLLEDICHQVLDLYSSVPQKSDTRSPNQGAGGTPTSSGHTPSSAGQTPTQSSQSRGGATTSGHPATKNATVANSPAPSSQATHPSSADAPHGQAPSSGSGASSRLSIAGEVAVRSTSATNTPQRGGVAASGSNSYSREDAYHAPSSSATASSASADYPTYNPYPQYGGSFLNTEGQKTIQHLLSGQPAPRTHSTPQHAQAQAPPPPPLPQPSAATPVAASAVAPPGYLPSASYPASHPSGPSTVAHHSHPYSYPPQPPYSIPPPGYQPVSGSAPPAHGVYYGPTPSHPGYTGAMIPQQMPYPPPSIVQGHPGNYSYQATSHGPYPASQTNHM